jgi:hypothetical protein
MAMTLLGERLTEDHRLVQARLMSVVSIQVLQIWGGFDIRRIDESWLFLEPALMAVIERARRESEDITDVYFRSFRDAEDVPGPAPTDYRVARDWQTPAKVSLRVTGPVTAKRLVQQKAPQPEKVALVRATGVATRVVADGGRELLGNAIRRDRRSLGYARVTSPRPCAFCAMIAGRGPVFRKTTVEFDAHDHCGCTGEPVYDRRTRWPGRAHEFEELYKSSTVGADDPLNAFRRAYEAAA